MFLPEPEKNLICPPDGKQPALIRSRANACKICNIYMAKTPPQSLRWCFYINFIANFRNTPPTTSTVTATDSTPPYHLFGRKTTLSALPPSGAKPRFPRCRPFRRNTTFPALPLPPQNHAFRVAAPSDAKPRFPHCPLPAQNHAFRTAPFRRKNYSLRLPARTAFTSRFRNGTADCRLSAAKIPAASPMATQSPVTRYEAMAI